MAPMKKPQYNLAKAKLGSPIVYGSAAGDGGVVGLAVSPVMRAEKHDPERLFRIDALALSNALLPRCLDAGCAWRMSEKLLHTLIHVLLMHVLVRTGLLTGCMLAPPRSLSWASRRTNVSDLKASNCKAQHQLKVHPRGCLRHHLQPVI
jgi:hypothetical protein